MIKPPKLNPGDTIATISLSWGGPGAIPIRYEAGKRQLQEAFDVRVIESRYACADPDWLAKNPRARADDLMETLVNPEVQAIFSTIGGDDSIRILPYLDLAVIRDNPKIFMGYSDTTISHFAFYRAGVHSFYGPSIMSGFGESGGLFPYMENAARHALFSSEPIGIVPPNTEGWTVEHKAWEDPAQQNVRRTLNPTTGWSWLQGEGVATGQLLGGCLEVVDWLRGTEWWPSHIAWENAILFLEGTEDAPPPTYLQYFLRSLAAMGILQRLSAILFGRPGGQLPLSKFAEYDTVLKQVVAEEYELSTLPIVSNMDFGHTDPMLVLPYGVTAEVDCAAREFRIVESAVMP